MKKLILFVTLFAMLLLASCNGTGDGGNGQADKEGLVWNLDTDVYLVSDIQKDKCQSIFDQFTYLTEKYLVLHSDSKERMEHELVVGPTARPISQTAYAFLEENMIECDDAVGYVVLVEDGSVAVAYSSEAAYQEAINAFYENCGVTDYYADNGVVCYDFYSLRARAEQNRQKIYDKGFAKIEEQLIMGGATNAGEIVAEIRNYYSLIKTEQLYWLTDLYDPETGAFYHCNSGRDNEGFLPDLESTAQAFLMLGRGGLFSVIGGVENDTKANLPDSILEPLAEWIKGLQDPDTGYFYHPQWATVGTSRRGRDLDNAVTLFKITGAKPYYNDPSGRLYGIYGEPDPDAVRPAYTLTSRLGASAVKAVSAVRAAASNLPAYLQSLDAWSAYLDKLNINGNNQSYYKGNELVAQWSIIKRAGKAYEMCLFEYLNEKQIPETGLWEYQNEQDYDPSDNVGYNGTNGLMKISVLYSSLGYAVPNAYNALQSTVKVGLYPNTDPRDETVCYGLNIWTCLSNMMNNVKKYDPENFLAAQKLVADNLPALIAATYDLQHTHLMPDGGFSYYERQPMNIASNAPTGCSTVPESDTDATMVATTSTIKNMFSTIRTTFGSLSNVAMWGPDDYYLFIGELEKAQTDFNK